MRAPGSGQLLRKREERRKRQGTTVGHEDSAAASAASHLVSRPLVRCAGAGSSSRRRSRGPHRSPACAEARGERRKGSRHEHAGDSDGTATHSGRASNHRRSTDSCTTAQSFRIHRALCRNALGRLPCMPHDGRARARHGGHHDRHVNSPSTRSPWSCEGERVIGRFTCISVVGRRFRIGEPATLHPRRRASSRSARPAGPDNAANYSSG